MLHFGWFGSVFREEEVNHFELFLKYGAEKREKLIPSLLHTDTFHVLFVMKTRFFSLYFFKFNYFIRCLILIIFCIKISECCWNGGCGYLSYNLLMDWQCVPMNAHVIQISRADYKSSAVSSTFIAIKLNRKIFFPRSQTNWFFLYLFLAWLSIPIF